MTAGGDLKCSAQLRLFKLRYEAEQALPQRLWPRVQKAFRVTAASQSRHAALGRWLSVYRLQNLQRLEVTGRSMPQGILLMGFCALRCLLAQVPSLPAYPALHEALTCQVSNTPLQHSCAAAQHAHLPCLRTVQAFYHQTQMLLFHAVSHDQGLHLQFHRQPDFVPGRLGDLASVSEGWRSCEMFELQGWFAAIGMTDMALASLRLAARALAASEPFMQSELQTWAAGCPTLTGVGRQAPASSEPCLAELRRLLVRLRSHRTWPPVLSRTGR